MLNLKSIMIGSSQPKVLVEFYQKVFDAKPMWQNDQGAGWQVGDVHFTVGEHSEIKGKTKEAQRILVNFETADVQAEFGRIKKTGAGVVAEPYEIQNMWIATFSDPDGNYFQIMTPWKG